MNISKFLITSATALGIVGTIGFTVAQTATSQLCASSSVAEIT